jgi:hypothetical protein
VFEDVERRHYLNYAGEIRPADGTEVTFEPLWVGLKHRAMACYASQWRTPSVRHFLEPMREYLA